MDPALPSRSPAPRRLEPSRRRGEEKFPRARTKRRAFRVLNLKNKVRASGPVTPQTTDAASFSCEIFASVCVCE